MLQIAGIIVVISPLLVGLFGLTTLFRISLSERNMARMTEASTVFGLISAYFNLSEVMLATNQRYVPVEVGDWVLISPQHIQKVHEESHKEPEGDKADAAAEVAKSANVKTA